MQYIANVHIHYAGERVIHVYRTRVVMARNNTIIISCGCVCVSVVFQHKESVCHRVLHITEV